jgi:hypothetical protein
MPKYCTTLKHQNDYFYKYSAAEGTAFKGRIEIFPLYSAGTTNNKRFIKQTYKTKRTFAKESDQYFPEANFPIFASS